MLLIRCGLLKPICCDDIEKGEILVDGGKIRAVGRRLKVPHGCRTINVRDCLVTPGLVDAHCHVGVQEEAVRWEGDDVSETSNPVSPEMRAIDCICPTDEGISLALAAGVTSCLTGPGSDNVIGGTFAAIKLYGTCIDDMVIRNPVAMKIAFGENPKGCYGQNGSKTPVTRMAIAALLRDTLFRAARYRDEKAAAEKEGKTPPFDIKLEALQPVLSGEIPLKAHAHRADDIATALRIAGEFGLRLTLDHCTAGARIADRLAKAGRPCLVGPGLWSKCKPEVRDLSFATPGILDAAGVEVSIVTDAPVVPLEYLPLCAGLAVKAGMKETSAWRAITLNPAQAGGIDARVGSLEPGKDADIVAFNGNPLREIAAKPRFVMVDGEVVVS